MFEKVSSYQVGGVAALIALVFVFNILRVRFRAGLRDLPGPRLAAYSRLWNVLTAARGDAHDSFRRLHEKYGKVVRTGPYHVAIADASMIPVLYGTTHKFLKSRFYEAFEGNFEGRSMSGMFTTADPATHKSLKSAVSNKYSISALKEFEPQVNECNRMFVSEMQKFAESGEVVDFGAWLQWYAFDVIGAITFNRRFGFMEERRDVGGIIAGIEGGLCYCSIVGQLPELHPWLLKNLPLMKLLENIPAVSAANPIPEILKMCDDEIKLYDTQGKQTSQNDFLAWFRKEGEKSPDRMPRRDLISHLLNNLYPLERVVPEEGLTVGEVHLPKGTIVGMHAWVIHHDKSVYGADADDFRPERWIDSNLEQLRMMEKCFLSFGAGTRTCIGKNISMMEMGKLVPQVLRRFDLSWAAPNDDWNITTYWFAKQTGLHVRFHPKARAGLEDI